MRPGLVMSRKVLRQRDLKGVGGDIEVWELRFLQRLDSIKLMSGGHVLRR